MSVWWIEISRRRLRLRWRIYLSILTNWISSVREAKRALNNSRRSVAELLIRLLDLLCLSICYSARERGGCRSEEYVCVRLYLESQIASGFGRCQWFIRREPQLWGAFVDCINNQRWVGAKGSRLYWVNYRTASTNETGCHNGIHSSCSFVP